MKLKLGKIYYEESLQGGHIFYYCIDRFCDNGQSMVYYDIKEPEQTYLGDTEVCERYWKEFKGEENG